VIAFVSLLLLFPSASTQAPSASAAQSVTCAFSNPAYSGWCRVTDSVPPGSTSRAACRNILACLNNIQCIKTYCNATQIRGGWKLERVRSGPAKRPPS
jgi:hypothetical protein